MLKFIALLTFISLSLSANGSDSGIYIHSPPSWSWCGEYAVISYLQKSTGKGDGFSSGLAVLCIDKDDLKVILRNDTSSSLIDSFQSRRRCWAGGDNVVYPVCVGDSRKLISHNVVTGRSVISPNIEAMPSRLIGGILHNNVVGYFSSGSPLIWDVDRNKIIEVPKLSVNHYRNLVFPSSARNKYVLFSTVVTQRDLRNDAGYKLADYYSGVYGIRYTEAETQDGSPEWVCSSTVLATQVKMDSPSISSRFGAAIPSQGFPQILQTPSNKFYSLTEDDEGYIAVEDISISMMSNSGKCSNYAMSPSRRFIALLQSHDIPDGCKDTTVALACMQDCKRALRVWNAIDKKFVKLPFVGNLSSNEIGVLSYYWIDSDKLAIYVGEVGERFGVIIDLQSNKVCKRISEEEIGRRIIALISNPNAHRNATSEP